MPPPTLARRYFFKLIANLVSVPVYLVMEAILPRALGPQVYGNYSFATNLFQQLSGFLDMGTSTCFYNSLSRRSDDIPLLAFYLRLALIITCLIAASGLLCLWPALGRRLMPDMPLWLAPLAAFWAILTWWSRMLRAVNDAIGATIASELWRSALSLLGIGFLAALFFSGFLNLRSLFLQQYLLLAVTGAAFWHVSRKYWLKRGIPLSYSLKPGQAAVYRREFFAYSHPLFIQALMSFLMLTAERWLLQWFDGSSQQGFYALSQKVSMACFLFVSAMTPLLMREFSVAWGRGDVPGMGRLLGRFAPLLYLIAAYFSCFTAAEGRAVVEIFGGAQFLAATLPVQIMAFYPLHQAYGQMASSIFHASCRTKLLRNMTACECVYGLLVAWFLLAPQHLGGLNLGATGLAIKTVGVQFITVNIYLWLASRFVPFAFWKNLWRQLFSVFFLTVLAFASRELSFSLNFFQGHEIWRFTASGALYTVLTGLAVLTAPQLLGVNKQERTWLAARVGLAKFGFWAKR